MADDVSTCAGLPDGQYVCVLRDETIVSMWPHMGDKGSGGRDSGRGSGGSGDGSHDKQEDGEEDAEPVPGSVSLPFLVAISSIPFS